MFKIEKLKYIYKRLDVDNYKYRWDQDGELIVSSELLTSNCETLDIGELLPRARSGHKAFFYAGAFYIYGGYKKGEDNTLKDAWRYYPLMHHWEKVEPGTEIPSENLSCASTQVRDKLYQFGGSGATFGYTNSCKLYEVDLESLSFTLIKLASEVSICPTPGYGHSLTYSGENKCLYLCCGTDGRAYEKRIFKFSLSENEWSVMNPDKQCVTPRYRQESFVWREGWYIMGGGMVFKSFDMTCMHRFCFNSEKWEIMPILPDTTHGYPAERRGFASILYRNRLYIIGGSLINPESNEFHLVIDEGLWYIDLEWMTWRIVKGCKLPTPVDFFAAAVEDNGKIIIHGGRDDLAKNVRTPETFILWVDVPPLVELCWEKIKIWEKEKFLTLPLSQLMAFGLPRTIAMKVSQFAESCKEKQRC
ncbi:Kelch domain-containing protein 10-like protein [Oopsacas minuta]|uniref:Kelch domain-containing protein 10-like protein n=1 Tax=Oopsacas minuta TaxID=111878 RepID=A0AAV7K3X3_9METZ|nr:Kelch domain-containing protein 10-like protein [Oopsacas minuta]